MTSRELVYKTMRGESPPRTPVYGWVRFELEKPITEAFGSVENFEDHYRFDLAHIFGGPYAFGKCLESLRKSGEAITPEMLLDIRFDPIHQEDYESLIQSLNHHRQRDRFCYVQTPGIFEALNDVFGIENHLLYMALYPEELSQVYQKMADWNIENGKHLLDLHVDGIHISDDWGAQKDLLFSPTLWRELIYPQMKRVVDYVHSRGCFCSLHSDGCVKKVADGIAELGLDVVHPWQESAGMGYDLYLERYADKFAILILKAEAAVVSGDEMEGHPGIIHPFLQICSDCNCILHDPNRVFENIFIDPLEDIFLAGVHHNFESCIDMAVTQFAARNGIAINLKGVCQLLCLQNSHL